MNDRTTLTSKEFQDYVNSTSVILFYYYGQQNRSVSQEKTNSDVISGISDSFD